MFGIRFTLSILRDRSRRRPQSARCLLILRRLRAFASRQSLSLIFGLSTGLRDQPEIIVDPDGNPWFTDPDKNVIGQITPDGSVIEFLLP
jgi:hypothetical protein